MNNTITWKDKVVWTLSKENGVGLWESREQKTGQRITRGRTRKSCLDETIKILEAKGIEETLRCIEWNLKNTANKEVFHSKSTASQFKNYFNTEIRFFFCPFTDSFDIIRFDCWLKTPAGISTRDYLTEKYSKEASDFVAQLNTL